MVDVSGVIAASTAIIRNKIGDLKPIVGMILGSGLGPFADEIENPVVIPYGDLPGFPLAGVAGHVGQLVLGTVGGTPVAVMQGRVHYYETGSADAMAAPVRTLKAIGCDTLLLTNAAGSINMDAGPGSVMLLSDHISFTGVSPLFGEQGNERFVDLSEAYDRGIRERFESVASEVGVTLYDGIYMWFCGPHFETPAEIRAAKVMGATAVGMSTVPEVILGRHAGMKISALSIITNHAAGLSDIPLSHEHTMANAEVAAVSAQKILRGFLTGYKG